MEEIISELITEDFINEERFAIAFAGGRFRLKKWGRLRIENELRKRGLTDYCIRKGMAEIEDAEYMDTALGLIRKKWDSLSGTFLEKRQKTQRFMAGKGYEFDLINEILKRMD